MKTEPIDRVNLAFCLRVSLHLKDPPIMIYAYDDLGWDSAGRVKLRAEVRQGGRAIFPKGQLYCALHGTSDGPKAKELVMSLVAMQAGDTDYFAGYTPAQLAWAATYGEAMACEASRRYGEAP